MSTWKRPCRPLQHPLPHLCGAGIWKEEQCFLLLFFPYNISIDSLGISHHTPQSHSFPRLSMSAPWPCDYPVPTKKETTTAATTKEPKSNVCSRYTRWCIKLPVTWPFSRTEFLPTPARTHQLWRASLQYPRYTF